MTSAKLPAAGEPDEFPLDNTKLNIVFVGSEVSPWAKTGGLGDVMRDLPVELASRGHRVMTVTPRYDQYAEAWDTSIRTTVTIGKGKEEKVSFFHCFQNGVDRVFVDHPCFLEKVWGNTGSKVYGPKAGVDYPDGPMRFSLLCQAALEAPLKLHLGGFPYGENVLFVPNDWHAALLPLYMKSLYRTRGIYTNAKTIFILHNIVFQGRFPVEYFDDLNLPAEFFPDLAFESCFCSPPLDGESDEPTISLKPMRMINILKAGFIHADRLVTVSPSFAEEVMSGKKLGVELDEFIRKKGIIGIINGMDMVKWNPQEDKFLAPGYDAATAWLVKRKLKTKLQAELGLVVDADAPLIGFVGRLDPQKGIDLLMEAVPELIESLPLAQFVLLGTGQAEMMRRVKEIEAVDPTRIAGITQFTEAMEHKLTGAADYMAMPSRFEPCGLVQLHAMRYGCVPIVTNTGGLKDSVIEGLTGYHITPIPTEAYPGVKLSPEKLELGINNVIEGITNAVKEYGTEKYRVIQKAAMSQDLTWTQGVQEYEKEIKTAISEPVSITKTEAELVRSTRNGGVKSSITNGAAANDIVYPWTKSSVSVDEGMKNRKEVASSKTLPIRENTKVPSGGPISTIAADVRGGPGGAAGAKDKTAATAAKPASSSATTTTASPAPKEGTKVTPESTPETAKGATVEVPETPADYSTPSTSTISAEKRGGFLGIFKKVDPSKPVTTTVKKETAPKNYASQQAAPGAKIDRKPHAQEENPQEEATASLTKISGHKRPSPQPRKEKKKTADGS